MSRAEWSTARADVLVIGAGAAGMYAAIEAKRRGADVILLDKSMVGRGGATVMAMMTVAAAIGHAEPDEPELHLADTLAGGREINNQDLAALLCEDGPARILETREMGVRWAADGDRLRQVQAPGHSRQRCCYIDVLATGTGVSTGMRKELRRAGVTSFENVMATELIRDASGRVVGAAALDAGRGEPMAFWAPAVVLACGGLTELYARNSAAMTMTGDAYALALGAGAELVDMEMVQFFPIANLAPRLIGLDPIMWDPFRYRLGGRLRNGRGEEFLERYAGVADEGRYTATRDVVSYAILKEVEAGRGSPSGGAYLDFTEFSSEQIHNAFPPVVDKLLAQGIDLTQRPVEVAPMAHYMIGGIRAAADMSTAVPGLFAAGEAVGGAHGANRLSGNAITEAFVFGARAGASAADYVGGHAGAGADGRARTAMAEALGAIDAVPGRNVGSEVFLPALRRRLQQVMWDYVGPLRDAARLERGGSEIARLATEGLPAARVDATRRFNMEWVEHFELRNMLRTAEAVRRSAEARKESRGAHQREDFVDTDETYGCNGVVRAGGAPLAGSPALELEHEWVPTTRLASTVAG